MVHYPWFGSLAGLSVQNVIGWVRSPISLKTVGHWELFVGIRVAKEKEFPGVWSWRASIPKPQPIGSRATSMISRGSGGLTRAPAEILVHSQS